MHGEVVRSVLIHYIVYVLYMVIQWNSKEIKTLHFFKGTADDSLIEDKALQLAQTILFVKYGYGLHQSSQGWITHWTLDVTSCDHMS